MKASELSRPEDLEWAVHDLDSQRTAAYHTARANVHRVMPHLVRQLERAERDGVPMESIAAVVRYGSRRGQRPSELRIYLFDRQQMADAFARIAPALRSKILTVPRNPDHVTVVVWGPDAMAHCLQFSIQPDSGW